MTTSTTTPAALLGRRFSVRSAGVVYALILIVVLIAVLSEVQGRPSYLSSINLSNVLDQAALIGILAIFMTVVLITGNFDLSVASTAAFTGTVALQLVDPIGAVGAIGFAILAGAAVGLVNAVLVQKVGVNAFIVTLGTLTAVRGIVQVMLDGRSITADSTALLSIATARWSAPIWLAVLVAVGVLIYVGVRTVRSGDVGRHLAGSSGLLLGGLALLAIGLFRPGLLDQTLPTWLMLGLAIAVAAVLRYTVLGRKIYAVGGNPEAARLSGINVDRYKMGAFVLNGAMAGAVGVLYAGRFNSINPTVMSGDELTVIAAAVLGGTSLFGGSGFVGKSVVGALILFTLSNGFNVLNIGANYQDIVQGGVLVAAAALYTVTNRSGRRTLRELLGSGRSGGSASSVPTTETAERPREPVG